MGMTDTASRIIDRFGQIGVIEREGEGQTNPWDPPAEPSFHLCTVAVGRYDADYLNGTLIEENDRRVFLSVDGLEIEPKLSDRLAIGDDSFSIVSIHPLAPDGDARFYELQARL